MMQFSQVSSSIMTHEMPVLTIITPSFNQAAYIEQTILSVMAQSYPYKEHIIIDGGSTDNTTDILRNYPHLKWISEKDNGQAAALKKGLAIATGEIIGWINSDDYYEKEIFGQVIKCFQDPETKWAIGNLTYFYQQTGETISDRSPIISYKKLLRDPDKVRQQPTFFRKYFLEHAGNWNQDYFMVLDFDLWVRLAKLSHPKMVDSNWAYFRIHEFQKTSLGNAKRQLNEIMRVLRRERAPWNVMGKVYIKKYWFLIKGYVKDSLIRIGIVDFKYKYKPMRHRMER
jgi:glycosyltransferase involved in cell wall biosynthesis